MEEFIKVAKRELNWEVDYIREAECTKRFGELLKEKPDYKVPSVIGKQNIMIIDLSIKLIVLNTYKLCTAC